MPAAAYLLPVTCPPAVAVAVLIAVCHPANPDRVWLGDSPAVGVVNSGPLLALHGPGLDTIKPLRRTLQKTDSSCGAGEVRPLYRERLGPW